ncbi:MAG: DUF962 domain-containing protein [Archangiaceae bacterium]|nr:DUF962 domain-containing protein [Archangiaceae bacterium]
MRRDLVEWQWAGYPEFHGSKLNLLIHIVAVPMFILSTVNLGWSLVHLQPFFAIFALGGMLIAFAAQAVGHAQEKSPAIPFDGPLDAVSRIFVEQFFNFPRFVVSGGWWKAYRAAE